eukprot:15363776-Ditylum_brightwellii.AAC.2
MAPVHKGEFAKSSHKVHRKESIFKNYNKMDTPGTFTSPMIRSDLPPITKVLCTQPVFKVKLQEEANMYKLYT